MNPQPRYFKHGKFFQMNQEKLIAAIERLKIRQRETPDVMKDAMIDRDNIRKIAHILREGT